MLISLVACVLKKLYFSCKLQLVFFLRQKPFVCEVRSYLTRDSSQFNANSDTGGFFRKVPFVIKPTVVIKTTNIKLNFITAGFSNFPVLCASPLRLPWSSPKGEARFIH